MTDFLTGGSFDGGFMNAMGDAVFINGANDTLVSVVDMPSLPAFNFFDAKISLQVSNPAPVPEPASVWLVGMGLMVSCMVSVKRRRNFKVRPRKKSGW